jgi:hypothetical protein
VSDPKIHFSDQIQTVLERLADGMSLRSISKLSGMPKVTTFLDWVGKDAALAEQYARAREAGQDAIGEEILEIVDQATPDTATRDRLRFDARRWYLSKLAPKRYGDKVDVNHGGQAGNPVQHNVTVSWVDAPEAG